MRKETLERLTIADIAEIARAIGWDPVDLFVEVRKAYERETTDREREAPEIRGV